MAECTWLCPNKQDPEYVSSPNSRNAQKSEYGKVLNMAGISICERYTAFWLDRVLDISGVLNVP